MSYIRSGSNPECLYIFGSRAGVEIYAGRHNVDGSFVIPKKTWNTLCERYVDFMWDDDDGVEVDGYYVRPEWELVDGINTLKTVLGYKDEWRVPMWDVTWHYVTSRYEREWYAKNVHSFRAKVRKLLRRFEVFNRSREFND